MALTTEDGTGLSTADSYASVAESNTYQTARGHESTWSDLDEDVKEPALRAATDYMLATYRNRWSGKRVNGTQALDWPREGVTLDGYDVANNVVPTLVKQACIELAYRALSAPLVADVKAQRSAVSVGPISVTYAQGGREQTRYEHVDRMLEPLLAYGSGVIRVSRA